jgi:hypothetical protein
MEYELAYTFYSDGSLAQTCKIGLTSANDALQYYCGYYP